MVAALAGNAVIISRLSLVSAKTACKADETYQSMYQSNYIEKLEQRRCPLPHFGPVVEYMEEQPFTKDNHSLLNLPINIASAAFNVSPEKRLTPVPLLPGQLEILTQ